MVGVLNKILKLLPGDGFKTILGAAAVVLSALISFLLEVAPVFPEYPALDQVLAYAEMALEYVEYFLELFGYGYAGVGLFHKGVKKIDK